MNAPLDQAMVYESKKVDRIVDTTIYVEEALHRLVEIHYKIGLIDESKKYAVLLGYNYQSSEWYRESYKVFNKKYSKVSNNTFVSGNAKRLEDASGRYSEFLKSTLNKKSSKKKLKIVLDCANGATYNIAPNLFWELGHNVIAINNNPDGLNINKNCGAVDVKSL